MELWIRSQHKGNLVLTNSLEIEARNSGLYEIWDYTTNDHFTFLGEYKTKERALEVLDEIEERISLLNTMCLVHDTNSLISFKKAIGEDKITGLSYPYQMPKE